MNLQLFIKMFHYEHIHMYVWIKFNLLLIYTM